MQSSLRKVCTISIEYLFALFVHREDDRKEIINIEKYYDRSDALIEFLTRLPTHTENWSKEFVKALKAEKYDDAVRTLEPLLETASKFELWMLIF